MKQMLGASVVLLLFVVGLWATVDASAQHEHQGRVVYESKSPLAHSEELLQLVTDVEHCFQVCPHTSTCALIYDEWWQLTNWLTMAHGRQPKDFKQRCQALRGFIQQSPDIDLALSQAMLNALSFLTRKYKKMSVGVKVGIGIGVATVLAAVAMMSLTGRRGGNPPRGVVPTPGAARAGALVGGLVLAPDTGRAHASGVASSGVPDTTSDEAIARELGRAGGHTGSESGAASNTPNSSGGLAVPRVPRAPSGGDGAAAGSSSDVPDTTHDAAVARELQRADRRSSHRLDIPNGRALGSHDEGLARALEESRAAPRPRASHDTEAANLEALAKMQSIATMQCDAVGKLNAYKDVLTALADAYFQHNEAAISAWESALPSAETGYNALSREAEAFLRGRLLETQLHAAFEVYSRAKRNDEDFRRSHRAAPSASPIVSTGEPVVVPTLIAPTPQSPGYTTPELPGEMKDSCDEAYALHFSCDAHNPVKAAAWSLYQAYVQYSEVYKTKPQPLAEGASQQATLAFGRQMRLYTRKLSDAQTVINMAQEALDAAQSGSGAPSGAGAGAGSSA
jgi:hypothetical protein